MSFISLIFMFLFFLSVYQIQVRILWRTGCFSKAYTYVFVLVLSFVSIFISNITFALMIVAFFPLFLFFLYVKTQNHFKTSHHQRDFLVFLEKLDLKIRNGANFNVAIDSLKKESDAFMQQHQWLNDALVSFSTHLSLKIDPIQSEIFQKLKFLQDNPQLMVKTLKTEIKIRQLCTYFRRKSGQLTFSARFQSVLSVGMYLVFIKVQNSYYSWDQMKAFVFVSAPLMMVGTVFTQRMGKRLKWKI